MEIRFFAVQADIEARAFLLFGGPKRRDETDDLEQHEAHDAAVNRDGQHCGRLNNELVRIAKQDAVGHSVPGLLRKYPFSKAPTVPPTPCAATTSSESSSDVFTRTINAR